MHCIFQIDPDRWAGTPPVGRKLHQSVAGIGKNQRIVSRTGSKQFTICLNECLQVGFDKKKEGSDFVVARSRARAQERTKAKARARAKLRARARARTALKKQEPQPEPKPQPQPESEPKLQSCKASARSEPKLQGNPSPKEPAVASGDRPSGGWSAATPTGVPGT